MKKISLIAVMLIGLGLACNAYADDLSELDHMLNSEDAATTNSGATASSTVEATGAAEAATGTNATDSLTNDDSNSTTSQAEKIVLTTTGTATTGSVSLSFKKLSSYTEYKIYYSKSKDVDLNNQDNLLEKVVTANDLSDDVKVTIDGLQANTEYQFAVEAVDTDGNAILSTKSDYVTVKTLEQTSSDASTTTGDATHASATDNVIYNPVIKTDGNKIIISYKLGSDVKKVQISISDDAKTFKPLTTLNKDQTSYTITTQDAGKKYIKLVPINAEGELGICKIGKTDVKENIIPVQHKEIGKPKTGPETYALVLFAVLVAGAYAFRRNRA